MTVSVELLDGSIRPTEAIAVSRGILLRSLLVHAIQVKLRDRLPSCVPATQRSHG